MIVAALAALFFSTTFVLNRAISLDGGHWFWTASLRYAWMISLLCAGYAVTGRGGADGGAAGPGRGLRLSTGQPTAVGGPRRKPPAPAAHRHPALNDPFARVLLMSLGSLPLWLVLDAVLTPPPPSGELVLATALVALFSGVIATSLFLYARHLTRTPAELAAADCTQALEVVFSLAGEVWLLGGALPSVLGWAGLALTVAALLLYLRAQKP